MTGHFDVSPKRKRGARRGSLVRIAASITVAVLACASGSRAAQDAPAPTLEQAERAVAADFAALEETLLKMARYLRKTEPERADLLVRALNKSREERLEVRLESVADLLRSDAAAGLTPNFGDAIEEQQKLVGGMRAVLGLLRSEDRRDEIDSEQERLKALVKDLGRLIGDQKAAEAANRRGEATRRVAGKQRDVTDRTGALLDRVREADGEQAEGEGRKADGEEGESGKAKGEREESGGEEDGGEGEDTGEPGDGGEDEAGEKSEDGTEGEGTDASENSDGEPGDGKPGENDPREGEPNGGQSESEGGESQDGQPQSGGPQDGEPQDGQPQQGQPQQGQPQQGQPQQGQPQQGQPQQGQPQQGQPQQGGSPQDGERPEPQPQTPGAERIEEAKRAMEEAQQELEDAEREGAREKQAEAVRKLTEAKEALEEILRQLREEEAELVLRALEVRFQKMLELQQQVLTDTVALAAAVGDAEPDAWEQRHVGKARALARAERDIGLEGEKALSLLSDDGSSVAFPEALRQILADVDFAADLLAKPRADDLTQSVERDIVAALEEMIAAFRQELEELRKKKESGQQQPQQGGQPGEEGLVDMIAELKMLRTLQVGVNRRTALLGDDESGDVDVAARLRALADRQARIEGAAYDLAIGKNR